MPWQPPPPPPPPRGSQRSQQNGQAFAPQPRHHHGQQAPQTPPNFYQGAQAPQTIPAASTQPPCPGKTQANWRPAGPPPPQVPPGPPGPPFAPSAAPLSSGNNRRATARPTTQATPPPPPGPHPHQNHQHRIQPPHSAPLPATTGTRRFDPPPPPMQNARPFFGAAPHPTGAFGAAVPAPPTQQQGMPLSYASRPPPPMNAMPPPTQYQGGPPSVSMRPIPPPPGPSGSPGRQQYAHPPATTMIASDLPSPDPPTMPHYSATNQPLPVYYPKAHFVHGDFGSTGQLPPQADSRFLVLEDGNASPHFLRSTMYAIPMDSGMLRQTGPVDFRVLCTPLALPSQDSIAINGQDVFGAAKRLPENGRLGYVALETQTDPLAPPRCSRCNAYANAFWDSYGTCNFCGSRNPKAHVGTLGSGVGTIDYPVAGPYIVRSKPVQPNVVFAVDVTAPNCLKYLEMLVHEILPTWAHHQPMETIPSSSTASTIKVQYTHTAIVLVTCQGVYIPSKEDTPDDETNGFVVMPDIQEDPYAPLPLECYSWNLKSEFQSMQDAWKGLLRSKIPRLLEEIKSCKAVNGKSGYSLSCGGAGLGYLVDALADSGGRAIWISWRRPNHGIGQMGDRESLAKDRAYRELEPLLYTSIQETANLAKQNANKFSAMFYDKLAKKANESKVAIDIVLHTDPAVPLSFLDIATQTKLCQATNGRLAWISHANRWEESFRQALTRPLQFSGWDAILKVRCSAGLRIEGLESSVGCVSKASSLTDDSPELELSVVTPDTCIGVHLEYRVGGLPKKAKFAYIQSALLYTNPWNGQRRVRVSTLALRLANSPTEVFKSLDFGAIATVQLRKATSKLAPENDSVGDAALMRARNDAVDSCVNILSAYQKYAAPTSAQGSSRLQLPEKLQLLPLFVLGLRKSPMLRSSLTKRTAGLQSAVASPRADDRAYRLAYARQATPANAFWMVHPLIVDLSSRRLNRWQSPGNNLQDDATRLEVLKHAPHVELPRPVVPSISSLADSKVYLIDTCLSTFVLAGKDVPSDEMKSIQKILSSRSIEDDDHVFSRAVAQLQVWSQVGMEPRWLRPVHMPLIPVRPDGVLYQTDVVKWLVSDPSHGERDYINFILELQRRAQSKFKS